MGRLWMAIEGLADQSSFAEILAQSNYQAGHVEEWRDAVNTWFHRTSGIADNKGRVGASPNRIEEGEKMRLEGYTKVGVSP